MKSNPNWPVLTSYDQNHLTRLALPLGGIGTGTVSLGGRGDLRDWELVNRPAKGFVPQYTFFSLFAKSAGGEAVTKVLEGPIELPFDSDRGFRGSSYGLPRFRKAEFRAAYPFGQVLLQDRDVPLNVRLEAFNPLVPADSEASGWPVAAIRFVLTNPTSKRVIASVAGNVQNFIGTDGVEGRPEGNVNMFRQGKSVRGVWMRSRTVDKEDAQFGTMALTTTAKSGVSSRRAWMKKVPFFEQLLDFWDDFSDDGVLEDRIPGDGPGAVGSLAVRVSIPPGATRTIPFLLSWHFPNRMTWTPKGDCCSEDCVENYYTTRFRDAWDVAEKIAPQLKKLEADTRTFVRAFCDSDLPRVVKEAALYNLSTLRSQTCFQTADGRFFGWEGCNDQNGCCLGSCTHVWNYEQATGFLFGDLAKTMREVEFKHATQDNGFMPFRIHLPLDRTKDMGMAAADGQMGCVMKLYRDWQLSGDDAMLHALWPRAKKALEFAWIPGGWDADQDGVMEGCQHNTTDLEFYGPNPLMAGWYLGALRAAEEMALYLGEVGFAATCRDLFTRGGQWVDAHLFNGEFYEQEVRPPKGPVAKGLAGHVLMSDVNLADPPQQMGSGCMSDQLVGQFMAYVCGLGPLFKRGNIRKTLRSIMKHNFLTDQFNHANTMRAFTVNEEQMLVYGTYPRGGRPERPCFRFFENWTGVEYGAAVLMMQEGRVADGLKIFQAVRDRFDGRKRSPFDEPECGHHYARAMASWGGVLALSGFHYSGVAKCIAFAETPEPSRVFWSNGYAWGTFSQKAGKKGVRVSLSVLHGKITLKQLTLSGAGTVDLPRARTIVKGRSLEGTV